MESESLGLPVASLEEREELALQFAGWLGCSYSTATSFFYFILGLFHWLAAIQLHFLFWTYSTGLELFYCNTKVFLFSLELFHWVGAFPLHWIQI